MTLTPLKTQIIYPEPDGKPMAESDPARDYLIYGVESLKSYYEDSTNVYVSGNLWLSYEELRPKKAVCPDVFVIFGVENGWRSSYRTWENNDKTPDWVLEVTSKKTWKVDEDEKPKTYAKLGVTEYFQYDPTGDYLEPPIKGQRLVGTQYEPIPLTRFEDGTLSLPSQVLGLDMRLLPDGRLRFFNPQTGEYLRSPGESERERIEERDRADREQERANRERQGRLDAEAELEKLRQALRDRGVNPDQLN